MIIHGWPFCIYVIVCINLMFYKQSLKKIICLMKKFCDVSIKYKYSLELKIKKIAEKLKK